ncbi:MAG: response regulator [Candidatus Omnitrophota bacterium]
MKRILIVDEESEMAELLKMRLESKGYDVVFSFHEQALDRYKKVLPDLVLLDVSSPALKGFEVSENIKKENKDASILLMAYNDPELENLKKHFEQLGVSGYFDKLSSSEVLVDKIKEVIG